MIIKVTEGLYRGPRPQNLDEIKSLGIKTIISLESGIYELFHNDTYEEVDWAKEKIQFYWYPENDFFPPEKINVFNILNLIITSNQPILIHCKSGVDRTGFMVACYRMKVQGWGFDEAWNECKAMGMHWWYYWWKFQLKKIVS